MVEIEKEITALLSKLETRRWLKVLRGSRKASPTCLESEIPKLECLMHMIVPLSVKEEGVEQ